MTALSPRLTIQVLVIIAIAVLLAGPVIIWGRSRKSAEKDSAPSLVRSWIALALVMSLILFAAASFAVDDATLRSTLIGGLTASAGSAVAYYFSSKSADGARKDILSATFGTETVPDLFGMKQTAATERVAGTSFHLEVDPTGSSDPTDTVKSQDPPKYSEAKKGSSIKVTLAPPP